MLTHISISNYTIVSALDLEFSKGMTVITGETGAGKSIMLDALGLCLGDRADPKTVRPGCERAEVTASFDISKISAANTWLEAHDLLTGQECILRRLVTTEGRSRAYINGSACTLQDCAELGALLIDIHSQHAHQARCRIGTQFAQSSHWRNRPPHITITTNGESGMSLRTRAYPVGGQNLIFLPSTLIQEQQPNTGQVSR